MSKVTKLILLTVLLMNITVSVARRPIPNEVPSVRIPHDPTNGQSNRNSSRTRTQTPDELEEILMPKLHKVLSGFNNPESTLIYKNSIFISEMGVDTSSMLRDGSIYKFDTNGKKDKKFSILSKLISPMGMTISKDILYVADVNRVIGFSIHSGEELVEFSLKPLGATFLNDIVSIEGKFLIVTATDLKKVFTINLNNGQISTAHFDLFGAAPNGIVYDSKRSQVYIAANRIHHLGVEGNGEVFLFSLDRRTMDSFLLEHTCVGRFIDGISLKDNSLMISDWFDTAGNSKFYFFNRESLRFLEEFSSEVVGLADFDYVDDQSLLVAPDLIRGKIYIYKQ